MTDRDIDYSKAFDQAARELRTLEKAALSALSTPGSEESGPYVEEMLSSAKDLFGCIEILWRALNLAIDRISEYQRSIESLGYKRGSPQYSVGEILQAWQLKSVVARVVEKGTNDLDQSIFVYYLVSCMNKGEKESEDLLRSDSNPGWASTRTFMEAEEALTHWHPGLRLYGFQKQSEELQKQLMKKGIIQKP
jgi:hypothetical protein